MCVLVENINWSVLACVTTCFSHLLISGSADLGEH